MATEFTKGPWKAQDNGSFWEVVSLRDGEEEHSDCSPSVAFVWHVGAGTQEANARLIAAAPALYSALIALRSFMWAEGYADQTPAMAQADAAIEKAEASSE